ncbi:MAG: hypothetical protein R2932_60115 [Caldilineaceae bacterium]
MCVGSRFDAPVRKSSATDGSALNVRDDFDQISFAGNNGAIPWAAPWSELGEVDGPGNGNVAVTSFWGGALQGLRLQGAQMGAARAVQLGAARDAHMGLAFRRKGFTATDYVVVELSTDGGATWHELTRFTGPTTDAEIQYTDHALSAYLADRVMVRLLTAPNMSADAAFYLDAIDIRPDYAADDLANGSQVYLPFVAGVGGTTGGIHVRIRGPKPM